MPSLSYREDQIAAALERLSPRRRLAFGWSLCRRLLPLHALGADPAPCAAGLAAVWSVAIAPDFGAAAGAAETARLDAAADAIAAAPPPPRPEGDALAGIALECRHACLLLVGLARDGAPPADECLPLVRSSRECVESLARADLRLAAWDQWAEEKLRLHALVQDELASLYGDIALLWRLADDPAGMAEFRAAVST